MALTPTLLQVDFSPHSIGPPGLLLVDPRPCFGPRADGPHGHWTPGLTGHDEHLVNQLATNGALKQTGTYLQAEKKDLFETDDSTLHTPESCTVHKNCGR